MTQKAFNRRGLLGAALILPLGGCTQLTEMFGGRKTSYTLTPRGDRLVRWLQNTGKDTMMAPEAFATMGLNNGGRDIPAKQLGEEGSDGRYVLSLINVRQVHDLVVHRRKGEVLTFHHCDTAFTRFSSVRYPRNGKPLFITDVVAADADFQQQLAFWFDRMPGR